MLRWLRSVFAPAPAPKRVVPGPPPRGFVAPSTFTAHEDCWGQQELLPRANATFLAEEAAALHRVYTQENPGNGFAEIYQRRPAPFPLAGRHIPLDELLTAVAQLPVRRYQRVSVLSATGPERYAVPGAGAFGSDDCALVIEAKEGLVQALWVAYRSAWTAPRRLILQELLLLLGQRYDLVLMDWDELQLIDLADAGTVARFVAPTNPGA